MNVVDFPVHVYNAFVRRAKSGEIKTLDSSPARGERYIVGGLTFAADKIANRVIVTGEDGKQAEIAVKHFNRFVDAAKDGRLAELRPFARK